MGCCTGHQQISKVPSLVKKYEYPCLGFNLCILFPFSFQVLVLIRTHTQDTGILGIYWCMSLRSWSPCLTTHSQVDGRAETQLPVTFPLAQNTLWKHWAARLRCPHLHIHMMETQTALMGAGRDRQTVISSWNMVLRAHTGTTWVPVTVSVSESSILSRLQFFHLSPCLCPINRQC